MNKGQRITLLEICELMNEVPDSVNPMDTAAVVTAKEDFKTANNLAYRTIKSFVLANTPGYDDGYSQDNFEKYFEELKQFINQRKSVSWRSHYIER